MDDENLRLHRRVGAAVLLLAGLLVGWMVVGPHATPWSDRVRVDASFDQIGSLLPGASVRLAGQTIGVVTDMGPAAAPSARRWRVTMAVDAAKLARIAQNSQAVITPQGVLGKPILEIAPPREAPQGTLAAMHPPLLQGVDPPSLDRALERLYRHSGLLLAIRDELSPDVQRLRAAIAAVQEELAHTSPAARDDAAKVRATMRRAAAYVGALSTPWSGMRIAWHGAWRAYAHGRATMQPRLDAFRTQAALGTARLGEGGGPATARLATLVRRVGEATSLADGLVAQVRGLLAAAEHGTLLRLLNDPELYDLIKLFAEQHSNAPWRLIGHPDDQAFDREAWRKQFDISP